MNASQSNIIDQKLILLVSQNPHLYNPLNASYRKIRLKTETWSEIGKCLCITPKECRQRWKKLREQYKNILEYRAKDTESNTTKNKNRIFKHEKEFYFMKSILEKGFQIPNVVVISDDDSSDDTDCINIQMPKASPYLQDQSTQWPEFPCLPRKEQNIQVPNSITITRIEQNIQVPESLSYPIKEQNIQVLNPLNPTRKEQNEQVPKSITITRIEQNIQVPESLSPPRKEQNIQVVKSLSLNRKEQNIHVPKTLFPPRKTQEILKNNQVQSRKSFVSAFEEYINKGNELKHSHNQSLRSFFDSTLETLETFPYVVQLQIRNKISQLIKEAKSSLNQDDSESLNRGSSSRAEPGGQKEKVDIIERRKNVQSQGHLFSENSLKEPNVEPNEAEVVFNLNEKDFLTYTLSSKVELKEMNAPPKNAQLTNILTVNSISNQMELCENQNGLDRLKTNQDTEKDAGCLSDLLEIKQEIIQDGTSSPESSTTPIQTVTAPTPAPASALTSTEAASDRASGVSFIYDPIPIKLEVMDDMDVL